MTAMNEQQLREEVARLKQLLEWEQNNHRAFRRMIFTDLESRVIMERRQVEAHQRRTQEYQRKLLLEALEELEYAVAGPSPTL